jgi:carbon-monoxide dehydrogenase large subunit/6-hydroxypseudooxynicotine dehydrogenase subunit gamma
VNGRVGFVALHGTLRVICMNTVSVPTRTIPPTAAPTDSKRIIGTPARRLEDPPLVTGRACFIGDVSFPRQIFMRVARAQQAHGRIASIDTAAARNAPGVIAVWTAADIAGIGPIPLRETKIGGLMPYRQPVLAQSYVRYVGEPVAVVFATDAYLAEDAAELIHIDIEALPPILRPTDAPGPFDEERSTEPVIIRKSTGDVDQAMSGAAHVIELELAIGRHTAIPMETRGAVARYDEARDRLELHGAAKKPHWNRDQLAEMLDRPPSSVELYENHVGGGFGVRGELYPEDVLVCLAALRLRRPIKWIEDRREHLMATNHSRDQLHRIKAAVDGEGRLLAVDVLLFHDQGAYPRTHGARVPDMTLAMLLGPYRVPAYRATAHYRLTNKTPAATYRSPGRYEGSFVRERLMDAIAARLDLDPIELRRRNLLTPAEIPHDRGVESNGAPVVLDSADYPALLDKILAFADWDTLRERIAERRAAGESVGLGLGMFVEKSGIHASDMARVTVDISGHVEVVTGAASLGQGLETIVAQVCAETLGIDYQRIRVIHGQTDRIPFGLGAFSSRATIMTGNATRVAAAALRDKALAAAADMLDLPREALDIVDGQVIAVDGPAFEPVPLAEIARRLAPGSKHRGDHGPGLSAEGWYHNEHESYPYGAHIAQVCVDRETGGIVVEQFVLAYDVGRAINPMLVTGQLVGGVAQGLGGALLEEFRYDESGQPLALTFADYLLPSAHEVPPVKVLITEDAPTPHNPLGVKGAGEGGVAAAGAAIASAIDDALGLPGLITKLPVTPLQLKTLLAAKARYASASPHTG